MTKLNFTDIDTFREKRLLISEKDMAQLLGVSRMTYWRWVSGTAEPTRNIKPVYAMISQVLAFVRDSEWPTPEVKAMKQADRFKKLLEGMDITL